MADSHLLVMPSGRSVQPSTGCGQTSKHFQRHAVYARHQQLVFRYRQDRMPLGCLRLHSSGAEAAESLAAPPITTARSRTPVRPKSSVLVMDVDSPNLAREVAIHPADERMENLPVVAFL